VSRILDSLRPTKHSKPECDQPGYQINRVHYADPDAAYVLGMAIECELARAPHQGRDGIVIVCVGTDRATGDCLGPLIGSRLARSRTGHRIYGTLQEPVHAANMNSIFGKLKDENRGKTILAIDACLGRSESVGYITFRRGPLRPGSGVNKDLPKIGDMHITGTVNVGGFMEYFVLQNTRLALVMSMADIIHDALLLGLGLNTPDPSTVSSPASLQASPAGVQL